jgi:nitroreductase
MELSEAIKQRRSVRDYKDQPVSEDKLQKVIEAGRIAPSGGNRQAWKFIVIRDSKRRQELAAAAGQNFIAKAPVIIAAVATQPNLVMMCGVPEYAVDLAIAIDHMTLAAVDQELGTCWIGAFSQDKARDILKIPAKYKIVALLPLGFPTQQGVSKVRKPLDEIVCYEIFKE